MTKELSLHGRLRMAAACPDANAPLLAEAADAIEAHEAFRQEVSDIVEEFNKRIASHGIAGLRESHWRNLNNLIITEPDPIAEAWIEATGNTVGMGPLNAALEARGLEIREKGAGSPLFYPNLT